MVPHMFLWHPICLTVPQCLFGTPYAFMAPTHAFLAPHMPFWHPHKPFWHPTCLMAPHLPLWCHICLSAPQLPLASPICLYGATSAFWHPICLLQAPSAFRLPNFWKDPWQNMSGSQKGPWFKIPRVQFVDDIVIMCNNQSALPTASAIFAASFPRVRMCLNLSHHYVWAHKREFSLRSSTWNLFRWCPKKAKYLAGKAHMKVILLLALSSQYYAHNSCLTSSLWALSLLRIGKVTPPPIHLTLYLLSRLEVS